MLRANPAKLRFRKIEHGVCGEAPLGNQSGHAFKKSSIREERLHADHRDHRDWRGKRRRETERRRLDANVQMAGVLARRYSEPK